MNLILLISFLLLLGMSHGEFVFSMEDDEFDYKKDILRIVDRNVREISKYNKDYTFVVLFSTNDKMFECPNCQSLEKALSSYQQGYYKLEESESNPIVFAIARPEDGRDYFDRSKVQWVPYIHIRKASPKPAKAKPINFSTTEMLDDSTLVSWINEQLHVKVRTPISDDSHLMYIFFTSCFIFIFSLLFPMGKGLWKTLNTRSAYMKVCLTVIFLCMSCLPYIIIKSTVPYSENYNRKGKLIYHFFSNGEEKYTFEGFIFAFWVGIVFFCCYGFIFFLQKYSNSLLTSFVISILLGIFIVAILEIKRDAEFSMSFLGESIAYTRNIFLGSQSCIFCKRYVNYLNKIQEKKKQEWIQYFRQMKELFNKCFQLSVCFMEFDFSSSPSDKPKKGPPKRFLMRNASSTTVPTLSSSNPIKSTEITKSSKKNEMTRRFVPTSPCKDSITVYTSESAIPALEQVIPDFTTKNSTIETATKWKDKVDTFQTIQTYVKENEDLFRKYNEALIFYGLKYTNQCNASNVNIMRSGLEFFKLIISVYGIGPRMTSTFVPCLLNKIQEKALYSDIAEVLLLICEKVGPNLVMSSIFSIMKNNKKIVQQKAVLQWLLQVLIDFGAIHINVKLLIQYLQQPQALQSTIPDIKNASIAILIELYKQLGTVVLDLVNQFELPELQLKRIREELSAIEFDDTYGKQYQEVRSTGLSQSTPIPSSQSRGVAVSSSQSIPIPSSPQPKGIVSSSQSIPLPSSPQPKGIASSSSQSIPLPSSQPITGLTSVQSTPIPSSQLRRLASSPSQSILLPSSQPITDLTSSQPIPYPTNALMPFSQSIVSPIPYETNEYFTQPIMNLIASNKSSSISISSHRPSNIASSQPIQEIAPPSVPSSNRLSISQPVLQTEVAFTLESLIEPVDITSSIPPILSNLQNTEGKESWKHRQDGVDSLISLLESKVLIKNNESIQQLLNILKLRLNESNLNLRAKMIQAIGLIANRIGMDIQQYSHMIIPEVVKNVNDTKQQVIDATFTTLSRWVIHQDKVQSTILLPILPYFQTAIKTSKSRYRVLQWFLDTIPSCEGNDIRPIIPIVLDGLLDKAKETRTVATSLLTMILTKWSNDAFLKEAAKRKPIDASQLKTIILSMSPQSPSFDSLEDTPVATPVATPAKPTALTGQRKQALANRSGAQVLHKRKLGPDGKPIQKFNVQSSIPKPMPRISRLAPKQEPVIVPSYEPESVPVQKPEPEPEPEPEPKYPLDSPVSIDSIENLPHSIPSSPKIETRRSNEIKKEERSNETPHNETPSLLDAVSFGISINQTELLFDDENDERKTIVQANTSPFIQSFLSLITQDLTEENDELILSIQSIIKACYPTYPVESVIMITKEDLQVLCEKKQQWLIPIFLSFLPHSSYQVIILNLLFCIVSPSSSLSQMVPTMTSDEIAILLHSIIPLFFEDLGYQSLLSCILEFLIKQASILPFIWGFLHFAWSKQHYFSNSSFYQLLEICITQIHKRVENDTSLALDEKEVDSIIEFSKKALPSSLASQIEVCILCLPKKQRNSVTMDEIKKDVVLPSYLQNIIDHRVMQRKPTKENSQERMEGDVDQRMAQLRERMRQLHGK